MGPLWVPKSSLRNNLRICLPGSARTYAGVTGDVGEQFTSMRSIPARGLVVVAGIYLQGYDDRAYSEVAARRKIVRNLGAFPYRASLPESCQLYEWTVETNPQIATPIVGVKLAVKLKKLVADTHPEVLADLIIHVGHHIPDAARIISDAGREPVSAHAVDSLCRGRELINSTHIRNWCVDRS